jgi:hypothetical protein
LSACFFYSLSTLVFNCYTQCLQNCSLLLCRYLSLPTYEVDAHVPYLARANLDLALQNLDKINVVGLTEYYGVSLCLLLYRLGFVDHFSEMCRCDASFAIVNNDGARPSHRLYKRVGTFYFTYAAFHEVGGKGSLHVGGGGGWEGGGGGCFQL